MADFTLQADNDITFNSDVGGGGTPLGNDMFREFFGLPQMPPSGRVREGAGSGFVIDADGLTVVRTSIESVACSWVAVKLIW